MLKFRRSAKRGVATVLLSGAALAAVMSSAPAAERFRDAGLASVYLAGRHAETAGDTSRAVTYLSRAIELDPNNQSIRQTAYFLALQAGDYGRAIPEARKSFDAAPRRGMAAMIVAAEHMKRGEYDRAWAIIDKIPTQNVAGFALPLLRAWAAAGTQPAEKAVAELQAMKTVRGSADLVEIMTGQLYESYGKSADALAHYDTVAARVESERISEVLMAAEGYDRLGKTAQAKTLLTKFLASHPGVVSPTVDAYMELLGHSAFGKVTPATGMASALYAAAEMLISSDPNEFGAQIGVAFAQTALYLNPDLSIARRFVGATLAARNRLDEANAMLTSIKHGTPGYFEAQIQVAENLARANKTAEALTVLKGLLKDRPNWVDVHLAVGDIYRREKKFPEAVEAYDAAIKLTPDTQSNAWALYYTRGMALERAKNWDAAEKDFRKALKLKPEEPSVLNYLGYSYLDRGVNLKEGRKLIEQAYNKKPDDGYIVDSMGWALFMNGEFDQAVQHLEKAVESAPGDATINEHLGDAYWRVGRQAEARFQWERALVLGPEEQAQRNAIANKIEKGLARK